MSGDVHEMQRFVNRGLWECVQRTVMKTSYFSSMRAWGTAALAALCLFAFTSESYAGGHRHRHHNHRHHYGRVWHGHHHHHYNNRYYRPYGYAGYPYAAYPRSGFTITFGNGYAGRGYYYGPPRMRYYNRGPGVMFYSRRAMVPSRYW